MDSLSSLSPPVKLVPLSDLISLTWPLLAINRLHVIKKESVSKLCTTSTCTARITKHAKMTSNIFTRLRSRRTWKGPKQSIPTDVKGGRSGVNRSTGRSAIFCSQTGPWWRRQSTHLESALLMTELALIIQNFSRAKLKTNFLPECLESR